MAAGYLFSVGSQSNGIPGSAIEKIVRNGFFSTLISLNWTSATLPTLGDYITVQPGDNVYFFSKRYVFGIGEVVSPFNDGTASFECFPGSTTKKAAIPDEFITANKCQRWGIMFKPSPHFFRCGIDMDDLLQTDPSNFRSLRAFWKRSFIQLDDAENLAFKSALIRANERFLLNCIPDANAYFDYAPVAPPCCVPEQIETRQPQPTKIDLKHLLLDRREANGSLGTEMLVEDAILFALTNNNEEALKTFGRWDYLSHQVPASPFKPIEYMDKMDIFGYRWVKGYEGQIVSKYLVIEIKKNLSDNRESSSQKDYAQLMKYVDWVCSEYAHGDYTMIEAYLVAHDFQFSEHGTVEKTTTRSFVRGHSSQLHVWEGPRFIKYDVDASGDIHFFDY